MERGSCRKCRKAPREEEEEEEEEEIGREIERIWWRGGMMTERRWREGRYEGRWRGGEGVDVQIATGCTPGL